MDAEEKKQFSLSPSEASHMQVCSHASTGVLQNNVVQLMFFLLDTNVVILRNDWRNEGG